MDFLFSSVPMKKNGDVTLRPCPGVTPKLYIYNLCGSMMEKCDTGNVYRKIKEYFPNQAWHDHWLSINAP